MKGPSQQELEWGDDWAADEEPITLDQDGTIGGEVVA